MASTIDDKSAEGGTTALGIALQGKSDEAIALFNEVKDLKDDAKRERLEELRTFAPFNQDIAYLVAELDGLAAQYSDEVPAHRQPQTGDAVTGDEIRKEIVSVEKPAAVSAKGDKDPNPKDSDVNTDSGNGKVDAKDTTSDEGSSKPGRGSRGNQSGQRSDGRRPRQQRAPFVIVLAAEILALILLLRRPGAFDDRGPRKGNLKVDKDETGRVRVRVMVKGAEHSVILPAVTTAPLAKALEAEVEGPISHGVEFMFMPDDNVKLSSTTLARNAQRGASGRGVLTGLGISRPSKRSDSPSMRTTGDFRSSELPTGRSTPSSSTSSVTPKRRSNTRDTSKPMLKPATFPKGFTRSASGSIASFLSGNTDLGIEVTDAMITGEATAAELVIDEDGIIRNVRWIHDPVCEAMTVKYVGEHPLAQMMDQGERVAKLRDREGIPAVRTEGGIFAMPFTQDATRVAKLTVESVLKACATIVRATYWGQLFTAIETDVALPASLVNIKAKIRDEADVRSVQKARLNTWLNNTFGEGNWKIDGDVVNSAFSAGIPASDHLNADGAELNFESVKRASEGKCNVEFDGCEHGSHKVLHGFGRAWAACKSCALGFYDALNRHVAEQLETNGIGTFLAEPLSPNAFIHMWPRTSDPESMLILTPRRDGSWPNWVPKTDDEADERLLRHGPFVVTGPRSWGFCAISGRFELKLTHLIVVQSEGDDDVYEVYPISSASASALVSAGLTTLGRPHKVGDIATYLIDRSNALNRRPQSEQQARVGHERHVERKVTEKFDMTSDQRDEAQAQRKDRAANRRDARNDVKEEIKIGMGYYTSELYFDLQQEQADAEERSSGHGRKKNKKKSDKSAASKAERDRMKGKKRNDDSNVKRKGK